MCTRVLVPVSLQRSFSAVPVQRRVVVGTWQFYVYLRVQAWNARNCDAGPAFASCKCPTYVVPPVPGATQCPYQPTSATCGTTSAGSPWLRLGRNHNFRMPCRPSATSSSLPKRTLRQRPNGSCTPYGGMSERHVPERGVRNR